MRRGRPVVVPYSNPFSRRSSARSPKSSVGYGPAPTRVVYALATPMTDSNLLGARPRPEQTPPSEGLELVTNGYVPKSRSSIVALAPSTRMRFPALCDAFTSATVSWM